MELYNIYIRQSGEKAQIKHAIDISQIDHLFGAITAKKESIIIDGKTIYLHNIEVINIFDVSKAINKTDKAELKNEIRLMKGKLTGTNLLNSFGYDITHKFEIPNYYFKLPEHIIYDDLLNNIHSNGFEVVSKDSPSYILKAIRELEAFDLITKNGNSYILGKEGYKAIEIGGFIKWKEYNNKMENNNGNILIIQGNSNNVNQQHASDIQNSKVNQINGEAKRNWLEIINWIVGTVMAVIGIYQFLK